MKLEDWPDIKPLDMDLKEAVKKLLKVPPEAVETADLKSGGQSCS